MSLKWDKSLFTFNSIGVLVSKRFYGSNNESMSLFSHFMKKSFKAPQTYVKITIRLIFQIRLLFRTGSVKFKIYLSCSSKCSTKTIVIFI